MKAKEFIVELFSQPLPYQWTKHDGKHWLGKFEVPGDKPLKVIVDFAYFENAKNGAWTEVAFIVNNKFELTGGGHALEIFATIGKMFDDYVNMVHPEVLRFSADATEPSRVKLYNRIAKGISQKYGYTLETKSTSLEVYFYLRKQ